MKIIGVCLLTSIAAIKLQPPVNMSCIKFKEDDFVPGKFCVAFELPSYNDYDTFCSSYANRVEGYIPGKIDGGQCLVNGSNVLCICDKRCELKTLPEPYKSLIGEDCDLEPFPVHHLDQIDAINYFENNIASSVRDLEMDWKEFEGRKIETDEDVFNVYERKHLSAHSIYNSRRQLEIFDLSPYTLATILLFFYLICGAIIFQSLYFSGIVLSTNQYDIEKIDDIKY